MHQTNKIISNWTAFIALVSLSHRDISFALGFAIRRHGSKSLRLSQTLNMPFSSNAMEDSQSQDKEISLVNKSTMSSAAVVDIGVNLTHRAFRNHWRQVVRRAIDGELSCMPPLSHVIKAKADNKLRCCSIDCSGSDQNHFNRHIHRVITTLFRLDSTMDR